MTEQPLRVVIADDQTSVRDGLVALLSTLPDFEVVGAAAHGGDVMALVDRVAPDAVLMDLRMPDVDGIEATRWLSQTHPDVAVVVLTTYADDESVLAALQAGARAYLTKNATRGDMARALHAAVAGQVTLAPDVQRALLSAALRGRQAPPADPPPDIWPDGLTEREGEILSLIASGLTNREIGSRLFIGNATVKTHINRMFAKIGARSRQDAIAYAERIGRAHRPEGHSR
ncbi:response regulator transcription factor [Streptomyces sp. NPDC051994]|uniref:response regulator transcription factor n=1 Tax=unclassified Streptomyces TaxID=2593676 RepID=UPI0034465599